jgi:NAD-dependent deacetylase
MNSTLPTSNQTTKAALWTIPCASVSANRTRTSVENPNSDTPGLYDDAVATDQVRRLAELVQSAEEVVVLTGAGISTESGIPDYRSQTGLWTRVDPMEYASIDAFRSDPAKVWGHYGPRLEMLLAAEPNEGHRALAELEERGIVRAVVTQNIDMLHTRAGSRDVVEVHGSIRTASCQVCGARYTVEQVLARLPFPQCDACEGVLKPDVVFFGELLPQRAIDRAYELADSADLLLVVGSTLEVYPVAALPETTLAHGGRLAIVNRGGTQYDRHADVVVDAGAGETLRALADALVSAR